MKKQYITTTLPYINAKPHLGHALEMVQADILKRAYEKKGIDVFFNTGTDEHGTKIQQSAAENNMDPEEYSNMASKWFLELLKKLDIKPTRFIRTTEEHHKENAKKFWKRCADNGYIYKKDFTGKYCVGCEMFKIENEIVNGECLLHEGKKLEETSETNYFFRLSKFEKELRKYLDKNVIFPERRKKELIELLDKGLEDISISRNISRVSWGVPVPDDETQTIYVWFDALTNYINTLDWPEGKNFEEFWPGIQIAGKDNLRQQAIIWQAMLMSIGIKNTEKIYIHGFITKDKKKMSKTTGNIMDPDKIIEKYGAEFLRYFLAAHIHPFEDSDITEEKLEKAYESDMVRSIGNIVSRITQMTEENIKEIPELVEEIDEEVLENYLSFNFNVAILLIQKKIKEMDKIIDSKRPFEEKDVAKKEEVLNNLIKRLFQVACDLEPVIPNTAKKIKNIIMENKKPKSLFEKLV